MNIHDEIYKDISWERYFYIRGRVLRKVLSWVSDHHFDSGISGNIRYFFDLLYEVHHIYLISRITVTLHDRYGVLNLR